MPWCYTVCQYYVDHARMLFPLLDNGSNTRMIVSIIYPRTGNAWCISLAQILKVSAILLGLNPDSDGAPPYWVYLVIWPSLSIVASWRALNIVFSSAMCIYYHAPIYFFQFFVMLTMHMTCDVTSRTNEIFELLCIHSFWKCSRDTRPYVLLLRAHVLCMSPIMLYCILKQYLSSSKLPRLFPSTMMHIFKGSCPRWFV